MVELIVYTRHGPHWWQISYVFVNDKVYLSFFNDGNYTLTQFTISL